MALPAASLALFSGVVLFAGAVTAGGISFTADTVARIAIASPVRIQPPRVRYGVSLPVAEASQLNIANSIRVEPALPYTQAEVSVRTPTAPPTKSAPQVLTLADGDWVDVGSSVQGWVKIGNETGDVWVYGDLDRPTSAVAVAD